MGKPFCWPDMDGEQEGQALFSLEGKTLKCPFIEMSMSITEKAGDNSTVIIAYGSNDCTSRLGEVQKTALAHVLFPMHASHLQPVKALILRNAGMHSANSSASPGANGKRRSYKGPLRAPY